MTKPCCVPSRASSPALTVDSTPPPSTRPDRPIDAVRLASGSFLMGTDYPGGFATDGEGPVRRVDLSPFEIDRYPVTNKAFEQFVRDTHYATDAERFGWSFVFWSHIPEQRFEDLVHDAASTAPWWCHVPAACWHRPEGPGSDLSTRGKHPVVHVSWNDARAYAAWADCQLPTEAQWEYAARGGLEQKLYPWGDDLIPDGVHRCNIWQGEFPMRDTAEDGYAGTSPVGAFPPNGFGLYSMTGNVWEWCADAFTVEHEQAARSDAPETVTSKVLKGGSFLCHESYCNRYRVAARTSNHPATSASNVGFRCVRSPSAI